MIREAISAAVERRDLSEEEAAAVMEEILSGEATPAQLAAFLTALRMKGETVDEIAGMARVMREKACRVDFDGALLDTCGTGGDNSRSFNVSTAAAFVAAGAGALVAKHGNRAMSSDCGSADVLEALGAKIDLPPEAALRCLERTGFCFMFAPQFHPAMRFAAGPRREMGIRTVFNILGPLCNPAGARYQVLGVADAALGDKLAEVLLRLGCERALVVHGREGLDELSVSGPSDVWEIKRGAVERRELTPADGGLDSHPPGSLKGGRPSDNALSLRSVLEGERGPLRDFTLLNAAAGLAALGMVQTIAEGVAKAAEAIDSGAASAKLRGFVEVSNELG
ncbi:MAG: anthranilate phosphoribosyltransferase [Dehalococcoidia bacterium]|nr:anthranilate phosphoribosyltransferase [Dehalococcoidia bacterium]